MPEQKFSITRGYAGMAWVTAHDPSHEVDGDVVMCAVPMADAIRACQDFLKGLHA